MEKNVFFMILLWASLIFSENKVIVLYGGSSVGKTSASIELGKILPGKWKVLSIDMFKDNELHTKNYQLWYAANKYLKDGYDVVIDTISYQFLTLCLDSSVKLFIVLTYCSPMVIADHVTKRNKIKTPNNNRNLKKVLDMYIKRYRSTQDKNDSIGVIHRSDLEKSILSYRALKKIKKEYFPDNRTVAYVASRVIKYDCFVDTGQMRTSACAQKIMEDYLMDIGKV